MEDKIVHNGDSEQEITSVAEELCRSHCLELVSVNINRAGRQSAIKLIIDRPDGVSSADCQWLSERMSLELDRLDPLPGRYVLEVSSPGVNRPLLSVDDYRRFQGRRITVTTYKLLADRRNFTGELEQVDDAQFTVKVDSDCYTIQYDDVASAKLAPTLDQLLGRSPKHKTGRKR